jgi:hypothetical protein
MTANEPYRLEESTFHGSQVFDLGYKNGPYRPENRDQHLGALHLKSWTISAKGR